MNDTKSCRAAAARAGGGRPDAPGAAFGDGTGVEAQGFWDDLGTVLGGIAKQVGPQVGTWLGGLLGG